METVYFVIVGFLLLLAVFDIFVGVSNDAVNFLNSAVGAKVARFKTILCVASAGIVIGALMSGGMMDIARHGIMNPSGFSFEEVMIIFLAVMASDVVLLDVFNSLGLPTSTTVSLVFELLGATFILALIKIAGDPSCELGMLLHSDKALQMIIAIFVSVAIAFVCGVVVQYLSRMILTFNYTKKQRYTVALFGGLSFTLIAYFIFVKGLGKSAFISEDARMWIDTNTNVLVGLFFVATAVLSQVLHLLRVNVFRLIVLAGTFALAMAFASNDLVNFIGVPLAGLSSMEDYMANGTGNAGTFMMDSLNGPAQSPVLYLLGAAAIMIFAMTTSKKAKNVVKTAVDLSRHDEGDEMFGSSRLARSIVRYTQNIGRKVTDAMPFGLRRWIDGRFSRQEAVMADGAAFDVVRAAVNLVLASALIVIGTLYKLPLSTTYVTFMVAMGASLADRAWGRESAVFRVTGVISVIGGWFVTAGVAFIIAAIVCVVMFYGGFVAMVAIMALVVFLLVRSNIKFARKVDHDKNDDISNVMLRSRDPEIVLALLAKHVGKTQSMLADFVLARYNDIIKGLQGENVRLLRAVGRDLDEQKGHQAKIRRIEYIALRRTPQEFALEHNTWFHLGANSNQQFIYCLKRMLLPAIEHVDNHFNPMPESYMADLLPIQRRVNGLMKEAAGMIATDSYGEYRACMTGAEEVKENLSALRKKHLDYMHRSASTKEYKISLVYLNLLQETQELLSIMRRQLRAANKFVHQSK